MYNLYIDEKGTQETFKMKEENSHINYGSDKMELYVGAAVLIHKEKERNLEKNFIEIEKKYKEKTQRNQNIELKTKDYINRSKFKYGFASLNKKHIDLVNNIFSLLSKNDVLLASFGIHKLSTVFNYRFLDYLYKMTEKRIGNAHLFYYSMVKYLQNDASPEILKLFFNSEIDNKTIMYEIKKDLKTIIDEFKHVKRMKLQIANYKDLYKIIGKMNQISYENVSYPRQGYKFQWNKVYQNLDLWFEELELFKNIQRNQIDIFLDNGIPKEPFIKLGGNSIKAGIDSKDSVGVRISDFFAVIIGNYVTLLSNNVKNEDKNISKHLDKEWFEFNEEQFNAVLSLNTYINTQYIYSVNIDTYFDNMLLFVVYIRYISDFKSYEEFNKNKNVNHGQKVFDNYAFFAENKYKEAVLNENMTIQIYGTLKQASKMGIKRDL